jgi:NADH-quinone oxidoreductase subunit L
MSPLFELSDTALSVVLVIGATTAFFMGLIGIVNNDIKRVVAYSTLSQLGYMATALGASAYGAGMFHLMTHAFFKALLFLAAGSVIIAMHHEQDMRYMGGLKKYMPITYWTCLIGSLALIAFPGFSGFFSKDTIIEAVHASNRVGSTYAYWCVLLGAFVTAFYSFRLLFMTFHGKERFKVVKHHHDGHGDTHGHHKQGELAHAPHESPWVVTVPLILLAIPSVIIGWITVEPLLYGGWLADAIHVAPANDVLAKLGEEFGSPLHAILDSFWHPTPYLAAAGVVLAWFLYIFRPDLPAVIAKKAKPLYTLLVNKFYFDEVFAFVFGAGTRGLGRLLWQVGDVTLIDNVAINGTASSIGRLAGVLRRGQSGYLYHYAFAMIIGLCILLGWLITR